MKTNWLAVVCIFVAWFILPGCGMIDTEINLRVGTAVIATVSAVPTSTPYPTNTPYPTLTSDPTNTPFPTLTPYPTFTRVPTATLVPLNRWVEGHYWRIKVIDVSTQTILDGVQSREGRFVLVDVEYEGNDLDETHTINGIDFMLLDIGRRQYSLSGMIYNPNTYDSYGSGARYQEGSWLLHDVSGDYGGVYRLVYDVPTSASGLRLWFCDLPLIDLGL